jgi:hypothetical protein
MTDNPEEIKQKIKEQFKKLLSEKPTLIKGLDNPEAYGHAAGTPLEEWVKQELKIHKWRVYFPNEFLAEIFNKIKDIPKILIFLKSCWWNRLIFTPKQLLAFREGKEIQRWQQEGADLVLFYGEDIIKEPNKIILLNVKSHESSRDSRPPNIMSAQRLLEFFSNLSDMKNSEEMLKLSELWFLGGVYSATSGGGKLESITIKDLFRLDVSKIPQINFDAAIQIQWHVTDMIEISQTKKKFVNSLADDFLKRWNHHSCSKQKKYESLVKKIKSITK